MNGQKREGEEALYEPILRDLRSHFKMKGDCHLEITAKGRFSEQLKKRLDDLSLYITKVELFKPDIMGYVESEHYELRGLVVVEVTSEKIKIKDILQARDYGSVFDAKFAFLISSEPLPEEIRRFYDKRYSLAVYQLAYYERVKIARFDESSQKIVDWYPKPPFEEW